MTVYIVEKYVDSILTEYRIFGSQDTAKNEIMTQRLKFDSRHVIFTPHGFGVGNSVYQIAEQYVSQ